MCGLVRACALVVRRRPSPYTSPNAYLPTNSSNPTRQPGQSVRLTPRHLHSLNPQAGHQASPTMADAVAATPPTNAAAGADDVADDDNWKHGPKAPAAAAAAAAIARPGIGAGTGLHAQRLEHPAWVAALHEPSDLIPGAPSLENAIRPLSAGLVHLSLTRSLIPTQPHSAPSPGRAVVRGALCAGGGRGP